jgi:hypothetical protein
VSVRQGWVRIDGNGEDLTPGATLLVPPADGPRAVGLRAERPTRLVRVVHGPGHGFVRDAPRARRGGR